MVSKIPMELMEELIPRLKQRSILIYCRIMKWNSSGLEWQCCLSPPV